MNKTSIFILAAAVAMSSPALAEVKVSNDGVYTTTVRYDDLDLGRQAGTNILNQRVKLAAHQVCGTTPDIRELQRVALHRACVAKAEQSARPQVEQVIAQARTVMLAAK